MTDIARTDNNLFAPTVNGGRVRIAAIVSCDPPSGEGLNSESSNWRVRCSTGDRFAHVGPFASKDLAQAWIDEHFPVVELPKPAPAPEPSSWAIVERKGEAFPWVLYENGEEVDCYLTEDSAMQAIEDFKRQDYCVWFDDITEGER